MHIIIVGSGIAGITFAEKYRSLDPSAKITVLTWETSGYYSRPMLSHGFSKENIEHSIVLKSFETLAAKNLDIISGIKVIHIDTVEQTLETDDSEQQHLSYDKLILAQGSAAFIPPPLQPYRENFFLLNSLDDLKLLRDFRQAFLDQQKKPKWGVIGGGLIGCEVASDLALSGDSVTVFHAMDRLMERQLESADSSVLQQVLSATGVNILLDQAVQSIEKHQQQIAITSNDQAQASLFDGVVVSCGFKPRIEIAQQAGLKVGRGVLVDQYLQTSDKSIYALGDVAEFANGKIYAYILPIRNQALWLANHLSQNNDNAWSVPMFKAKAKVHGFQAAHPYIT